MKKNKFVTNIIYAFIFQIINMAFPIIVSPYITRVLGVSNYGRVNYALNVANIFVVFVIFGTNIYGVKELAKLKNKESKKAMFISKILKLKRLLGFIVYLIFILISIFKFSNQILLYLIQGLLVFGSIYSLDWIFQSDENYRSIAIRTCIVKLLSLILIFLLVKEENDYLIFSLIFTLSTIISYFLGYLYIKNKFKLPKVKLTECLVLLKPLTTFFLIHIVNSLYMNIDTVILGEIKGHYYVGIYTLARTIIISITSVTLTISTSVMPRTNGMFLNDKNKYHELLTFSYNLLMSFAIPLMFGVLALSSNLINILGGVEYGGSIILLNIMSIIIVLNSIWTWNYYQRIIPNNLEIKFLKYQACTTILIIIMNLILIPLIGVLGSAISFVICEILAIIFCKILLKKSQKFKYINSSIIKYIFSAFVMLFIIKVIKQYIINNFIICIMFGGIIYYLILILLKEKMLIDIYNIIIKSLKEKLNEKRL